MSLIERLRQLFKKSVSVSEKNYQNRLDRELEVFADQVNVHDLPEIFHYWSNKYLLPILQSFGFNSPDDFFLVFLKKILNERPSARIISLGAGNGDLEIRLARELLDSDYKEFELIVTDINPKMLDRGRADAKLQDVEDNVSFEILDFNTWRGDQPFDVVMANQCLHHVLDLEKLFSATHNSLEKTNGWLLTSDMIGRNGHMRWPEALTMVQKFWVELPDQYNYNHQLNRIEPEYINHDCSTHSFEGIRAQDILPLLNQKFHFELFVGFGNLVDVFIDRAFGHNFNPENAQDLDFIDRVHAADVQAMKSGKIKPTHMIAALRTQAVEPCRYWENLSPEFCIRDTSKSNKAA